MKKILRIFMGTMLMVALLLSVMPVLAEEGDPPAQVEDLCPDDPDKLAPGVCGCGVVDVDSDLDGVMDCIDVCPGEVDVDSDLDGLMDCLDSCPLDALKNAPGVCGCGVADTDSDGDLVLDCEDACPADVLKTAPGVCGCGIVEDAEDDDGDSVPNCLDVCPTAADVDTDGDGLMDCVDDCPDGFECPLPEAPASWEDGKTINVNLHGSTTDTKVKDNANPTVILEDECADPDVTINLGNHNVKLTSPDDDYIIGRFGDTAINWLKVAVNVATNQNWSDTDERYVYWNLLGYDEPTTAGQLTKADAIKGGTYNDILQQVAIWFLVPVNNNGSIANKQLTFTKVCADKVGGCTDPSAFNYNPDANYDDNSCVPVITGCMTPGMFNYNPSANTAGECVPVITGCMVEGMKNYNPAANTPGACTPVVTGCLDEDMLNYNPLANTAGSCIDGSQISMALDPYCMGGEIFWQIDNPNAFPVAVDWSLTTKGSGSATLSGNGIFVLGTTPDAPGTYTLNVSWKGGSASLSSSLECDPVPAVTTTVETALLPVEELFIPVTGAELPITGQMLVEVCIGLTGVAMIVKGLKKQD